MASRTYRHLCLVTTCRLLNKCWYKIKHRHVYFLLCSQCHFMRMIHLNRSRLLNHFKGQRQSAELIIQTSASLTLYLLQTLVLSLWAPTAAEVWHLLDTLEFYCIKHSHNTYLCETQLTLPFALLHYSQQKSLQKPALRQFEGEIRAAVTLTLFFLLKLHTQSRGRTGCVKHLFTVRC